MRQNLFFKMKKNLFLSVCLLLCGLLMSCSNDNNSIPEIEQDTLSRILVLSEGNFTKGNSDLCAINVESDQVSEDVFRTINGRPLGDVGQSMAIINDKIYAVLNNSAKIEVFDAKTYKQEATILDTEKQISPRYIAKLSDKQALVTNMNNKMILINLESNTIEKYIPTERSTEQLVVVGTKVFIASGSSILVADVNNLENLRKIEASAGGSSKLVVDKNNKIWVIASAGLQCIDPTSETVIKTIPLGDIRISSFAVRLETDATKSKLYFNGSKDKADYIFEVAIDATAMPETALFELKKDEVKTLYNIGISSEGFVYICDARDYSQRGLLHKFNTKGELLKSYTVGIIPQYILFVNNK